MMSLFLAPAQTMSQTSLFAELEMMWSSAANNKVVKNSTVGQTVYLQ